MNPEEIIEQVLEEFDHRHFSEDFKASQIVKRLTEAGFMRKDK